MGVFHPFLRWYGKDKGQTSAKHKNLGKGDRGDRVRE